MKPTRMSDRKRSVAAVLVRILRLNLDSEQVKV